MINSDIFYPYIVLNDQIDLHLKNINEEVYFTNNILNFYNKENKLINLKATVKIKNIEIVLPENYKENIYEYLEVILVIKSIKSLTRKFIPFELNNETFNLSVSLNKLDWRDDVNISSILVLKKDIPEISGYASKKGSQLGFSKSYKILFDEPEEKEPGSGQGMNIQWISFKSSEIPWLNKHYYKDIYAIDFSKGANKLPLVYLNKDMNSHLKALLNIETTKQSQKNLVRDLMFSTISSTIFIQLITSSLIDFRNQCQKYDDKIQGIENAWEDIHGWQRKILENYASKLSPDSRKKDALENLKENLYEDKNPIPNTMNTILNIAQNSSEVSIHEIFTKNAEQLTKK